MNEGIDMNLQARVTWENHENTRIEETVFYSVDAPQLGVRTGVG